MICRIALHSPVAALLLCAASFGADTPTCPPKIDVHQQLAAPVAGWTALLDDSPHQLAGITFYDGTPQEKASLAYDDITKVAGKQVAKWLFAPEGGRPTWISCNYSGTSVQLTKSLPPKTTACEVKYDPKQQIAGLPVIEAISCR